MSPKVAQKSRETKTPRTRPSDVAKEKKVQSPVRRRVSAHRRRRPTTAAAAKKRRPRAVLGDNVGRDDAKWPIRHRSASVVLKLETVEIGRRMYDFKSTRSSAQLKAASPNDTYANYD
jgi:hypothetical protein